LKALRSMKPGIGTAGQRLQKAQLLTAQWKIQATLFVP